MIVETLKLRDFRAHEMTSFSFGERLTFLHGPNGAGKTNCLEALHYAAMSKSFLTNSDTYAIRNGARAFEVDGRFRSDAGKTFDIHLGYSRDDGKRIMVNRAPLDRLVDIVGKVPIVTFSPTDIALTAEGPDVRRRFIDNTLSQARPAYLADLLKYRRALRQRNALLSAAKRYGRMDTGALDAWTEELLGVAVRIAHMRGAFIASFQPFMYKAFSSFINLGEEPGIHYRWVDNGAGAPSGQIEYGLREIHSRVEEREIAQGRTLFGPHLDDVLFMLNNMPVRQYASRGQHRTFALALKLATFLYLKNRLDEFPVLLLDDVFAELDNKRTEVLAELIASETMGQSIITIAEIDAVLPFVPFNPDKDSLIGIENGSVNDSPDPRA